jgi:holliday junction DNA helicase RuvA
VIAFLQGQVMLGDGETIILNVRGVGYELSVSSHTLEKVSAMSVAQVWVHTHVREDALQLFGFITKSEKELFLSLLKVNGIGPKVAMRILSAAPIDTILQLIESGDAKGLSGLPKVGKKTAEQIILQLKGKLAFTGDSQPAAGFVARADITSALVNLGFKIQDVEKVVTQMPPETDFQDGVRLGLSSLAGSL